MTLLKDTVTRADLYCLGLQRTSTSTTYQSASTKGQGSNYVHINNMAGQPATAKYPADLEPLQIRVLSEKFC